MMYVNLYMIKEQLLAYEINYLPSHNQHNIADPSALLYPLQ